jgi:hypothetical protein
MEPVRQVAVMTAKRMALPALDMRCVNAVRLRRRVYASISLHYEVGRLLPACSDGLHRVPEAWRCESAEADDSGLEEDASMPSVWLCISGLVVIRRWIVLCDGEMFCGFSHGEWLTCSAGNYTHNSCEPLKKYKQDTCPILL